MNYNTTTTYTVSYNGKPMYVGRFRSLSHMGGMFEGTRVSDGSPVDTGLAFKMTGRTITPN